MNAPEDIEDSDWLVDFEISLIKAFGWSLRDIDDTDIESLLPVVARLSDASSDKTMYCDQVDGW